MVSDYEQNTVECGRHEMMNMNSKDFLTSLQEMRLGLIKSIKENDFEEGFRNLLSDLYPDKAHFIYELLQNAEDAKATEVNFQLTQTNLTLKHNGTCIFDEKDVEGITGIGTNTQKRDDVNVIGKFGVGFKAVFAYTESPRIYSRDFSFEIKDLFCPYPIETIDICDSDTQFVFPFNNPTKRTEDCFSETAEGLNGLSDITLLFLNNIKTITWDIEGQGCKHITRIATQQDNIIEIKRQESNTQNPISSFWLRFQRKTEQFDKLNIGVAFKLETLSDGKEADGSDQGPNSHMKIDSEIHGQLFIFFPAVKESTGLNFHINGPYASTIDRASIPHGHNDNKLLLEETATLLAESLPAIKDAGYLTKDFLDVLPNKNDDLADFYQPFIEKISSAMKEQPLMPTTSGTHVRADDLLIGNQEVRKLINDDDLRFFTGEDRVYWAPGVFRNGRADRFLQMLEVDSWNENELFEGLDAKFGINAYYDEEEYVEQRRADNIWLSNKTDEWMQHLYAYLANQKQHPYTAVRKSQWCILRTEDDKHLRSGDGVFFPTEESASGVGEVSFIKSTILSKGDKSLIEDVRTFLNEVDVKEVDEEQKIKHLLEVWYSSANKCPEEKEHLVHMKRFIDLSLKGGDLSIFGGYEIFRDNIYLEQQCFWRAGNCFIDLPFKDTGLSALYTYSESEIQEDVSMVPLWVNYNELEGFIEFAISLGAVDELKINERSTWWNPKADELRKDYYSTRVSRYEINEDYHIDNLDDFLACKEYNVSKLIWNTMRNTDPKVLIARYRPNQQYPIREAPSFIVACLINQKWIPNLSGEFCEPAKMTKDQLPNGFIYDEDSDWLKAIDFGKNIEKQTEAYIQTEELSEKLGVSVEFVDAGRDLSPANLEKVIAMAKRLKKEELREEGKPHQEEFVYPDELRKGFSKSQQKDTKSDSYGPGEVPDQVRRRAETQEQIQMGKSSALPQNMRYYFKPTKIWEKKNEDTRIFLREEYNGRCQICGDGFQKRDAEPYFEGLYMVSRTQASWIDWPGNVLCLCPTCCTKFQHGSVEAEDIVEQIEALRPRKEGDEGKTSIVMKLCGKECQIDFSDRHLIDLQELLKSSSKNKSS